MTTLKLFGILFFCGLFSPSQGVLSGLSCAISPKAMEDVLSDAILRNGLLQQHLQGLVLPNIMGEGGALNSPTIISGLHLVKVRLPKLSVRLLSGIGIKMTISARLQLSGNCLIGLLPELIDIYVDVKITANIKCTSFESGTVQVIIEECLCILGTVKVKLLSGLLSLSINDVILAELTTTLPRVVCPVVDIVINHANIRLLGTLNAVIPVGKAGMIHYQLASLPFTSGLFLGMDLDGAVMQVGGSIIPHDSSPSALPPLLDNILVLTLRQSFINAVLALMIQIRPQTLPCTLESFSGARQLQEAMLVLIPSECSVCRGTSPVTIKITLLGHPVIILEDNKATVELSVLIQLSIKPLDGPIITLLLLKADLRLNVQVSITGGRLVLVLSLNSISLFLESSDVGITDIASLKPHFSSLMVEVLLPLLNGALSIGIPLPNVLGIPLIKVAIRILVGQLVIIV
ncbi:BPI fold-containing family B member 4 isoform X2 [Cuculus canorus]|nr:BPI fold-containing family B member 4 isoform X2 [Cuculus canorus]